MPYIERLAAICINIGCGFKTNELLKSHTTFKIGGICKCFIDVNNAESLQKILYFLKQENVSYFVMGRGSNILASDEGYDGVILHIGKLFSNIEIINDTDIRCTAGVALKDICLFAMENSLTGLEFAYGIPGTCGGALYMNAGAYCGEIKDVVKSARYIDEKNTIRDIATNEMCLSYRHSIFSEYQNSIITDMIFSLKKGNKENINAKMYELMGRRRDKQPLEYPSAGSTFKRPEGSYASLLIDQCGLKGLSVGDAQVSLKHSGFIINKGNASCRDVLELAEKVSKIVKDKTGYNLELEPVVLR